MSFLTPVPGQKLAAEYLNALDPPRQVRLRVGGHSKGGNLACYGALHAQEQVQDRIVHIYDNDGPGFESTAEYSKAAGRIAGRITKIVPQYSIIGFLMENTGNYRIVKSSGVRVMQHDATTWQVMGTDFEYADDLDENAKIWNAAINKWCYSYDRSERQKFVDSVFELVTAMAFKYFAEKDVDIAVIETGMGGRLDCTNIITPALSIITNIGLDHTQFLGSTLEQIAMEKAGIIKPHTPVVIGEATEETRQIFEVMAAEVAAPITFAEDAPEIIGCSSSSNGLTYNTLHDGVLEGELAGSYQEKNANTILCAIRRLEEIGLMYPFPTTFGEPCKNREIREGFKQVCDLTGLKGRWQKVKEHPLTICDTGHNVPGWTYLSEQLKAVPCNHLHIVFGMVDDKDIQGVLSLLPKDATYYYTKANNKRAVSEGVLKLYGTEFGLQGDTYPDVASAYEAAKKTATEKDFVFIGGSSYVVAEFLKNCI